MAYDIFHNYGFEKVTKKLLTEAFDHESYAAADRVMDAHWQEVQRQYLEGDKSPAGILTSLGYVESPVNEHKFEKEAGEFTLEQLFEKAENGIYITALKGLHAGANAVTGDFSIESAGFMIRDGKKAEPIKSFTVAGNFYQLLKQIDRLGNEVKWGLPGGFTVFGSPDVLIRDMSVAGK